MHKQAGTHLRSKCNTRPQRTRNTGTNNYPAAPNANNRAIAPMVSSLAACIVPRLEGCFLAPRAVLLACVGRLAFLVRVCLRCFPAVVSDCLYMPNYCLYLLRNELAPVDCNEAISPENKTFLPFFRVTTEKVKQSKSPWSVSLGRKGRGHTREGPEQHQMLRPHKRAKPTQRTAFSEPCNSTTCNATTGNATLAEAEREPLLL